MANEKNDDRPTTHKKKYEQQQQNWSDFQFLNANCGNRWQNKLETGCFDRKWILSASDVGLYIYVLAIFLEPLLIFSFEIPKKYQKTNLLSTCRFLSNFFLSFFSPTKDRPFSPTKDQSIIEEERSLNRGDFRVDLGRGIWRDLKFKIQIHLKI